ncbi:DUF6946 family protein [Marinilabilia salmonicolor]|jgi:hypothetical protein|uniref:DUF6946 domain-containing protein n=1 Tax=Marinilabilia salmonicolor TaxID=989 RepID=A0A368URQ6_9BACT|nr:hypothetical protein [Marinilabilia salmonicolor]RCW31373.1 hypothetical protein DFO77_11890 [Marinilabilia salmonicolor]
MRIEFKGIPVSTLDEWQNTIFIGQKAIHWKKGRSAHALGYFIINKNGESFIKDLLVTTINEEVLLEVAYPEYQVRFDEYGHGREHDLGIYGETQSGRTIFVGVEAKVDETFGDTIQKRYLSEKAKELNEEKTNAPKRIEELLQFNFNQISRSDFDLRYQLLHTTAGTLAADADIHVLLVLVFKTEDYDKIIGKANYEDFLKFVERTGARKIGHNTYSFIRERKSLTVIYKEIKN